ncbi:5'-nucleotidase C-terminal domain-containing protein [Brevibacillus panacihumi]|uniref:LysM peptidoglycan-binding domain-containing protein n=1 Tax=Brevibacillus panacihumi TaxID=497735 RepID=A0A3M8C1R8_9BACL|nr:5'-nucleotidase C-terminal domain-containing protein [Brevibacillus panacihumi]RNB69604.1 LysM peptidoglycan-binding domain-containing protein [Brevibacillus panacihumi]
MKQGKHLRLIVAFVLLFTTMLASTAAAQTYTVKKGDNLWRISRNHGTTVAEMQKLNKLPDVNFLRIGQKLQLPEGAAAVASAKPVQAAQPVQPAKPAPAAAAKPAEKPVPAPVPAATPAPPAEKPEAASTTITILGTSDVHGNLWGYTYEDSKETANNGLARISTYVKEVKETSPHVLLIDNGDTYQGNILTDDIYRKKPEVTHPVSVAMNAMNYNAMVLGNHEFNFGLDLIDRIQKELKFPVLSANTTTKQGDQFVKPYTIVNVDGIKVGIIGVTTPNIPRWDGEKVDSLSFQHMGETVKKYAKELREVEKVDVLIASAHSGLIAEFDEDGGSDAASKIVEMVPDLDALLVGHMHIIVNEKIGQTVVGGPRNLGRDVVRFDLEVKKEAGQAKVVDRKVEVVDMASYEPDQAIRDLIKDAHEATIQFIAGGGGAGEAGASGGLFGIATADFQPVNEINGIPEGKLRDTAVVDLINKVQLKATGADVSAAALFKDTSDLKQGNITYANIFDIYKFDNTLYTVKVTGAELKNYMEWSAKHYNQWKEGDISISFDPEVPGYLYDMFAGVDYKIDLSKPAGERIVDVMYKGKPLSDTEELTLAVNNYRYSSALKAFKMVSANRDWESPRSIRDYLVEYIQEQKEISPEVDNNWEIIGINLESPYRDEVIKMVNEGKLEVPYEKSLNVNELLEAGVIQAK